MDIAGIGVQIISIGLVALFLYKLLASELSFRIPSRFLQLFSHLSYLPFSKQANPGLLPQRVLQWQGWYVVTFFLLNRLLLFGVAYFAYIVLENKSFGFFQYFQQIWHRWDVDSFLFIAQNGYVTEGDDRNRIAFYPLYSVTIHIATYVVRDAFLAGTLLSITYTLAACLVLQKLVAHEFGDVKLANLSVKYLLLYPFSYFATMVYSEGLFLLLAISFFYFVRTQHWWLAGLLGLLAATTKNQGVLLVFPMFFELGKHHFSLWKNGNFSIFTVFKHGLALSLIPCGILIYLAINKWILGDWFAFLDIQKTNWNQSFGFFAENLRHIFQRLFTRDTRFTIGITLPTLVIFFTALVGLIWGVKRLPASYLIYSFVMLIISYSPTWLLSGPRYMLSAFPLFILLALWVHKKPRREQFLDYVLVSLLTLSCIFFIRNIIY